MVKNKKIIIISIAAILVIAIVITALVIIIGKGKKTKNENNEQVANIDREKLEMEFKKEFLNEETEYVEIRQKIEQSKVGTYDVKAIIPKITIEGEEASKINQEIYKLAADIINQGARAEKYSRYNMEYTSFVNNNILSIVIRFTVKEGDNPRRIIVKTYNYDIENDKRVQITDIIDSEQEIKIQDEINKKIEESNVKANQSISKGYDAYVRDTESSIYKIKNATEFFIGKDNILYIIYAYGNQEYTEQMDLIMYKL